MGGEREAEVIESIFVALDEGDPATALTLAREALGGTGEEDPVLRFLAGRALLELDRPEESARELLRSIALDPDDPEFRAYAGWALFRACRFEEAARQLERPEGLAEAHYVRALLAERRGETRAADREFERAAELAPEWFPRPTRFSDAEFERQLLVAKAGLSAPFDEHLARVDVIVDDLPPDALIFEETPPLDPEQLLGLFVGVPLDQQSSFSAGGELPPRIHLFKRNLERYASSPDDLAEQIRVTLYHELGHYLGMDEEDLEESGYA